MNIVRKSKTIRLDELSRGSAFSYSHCIYRLIGPCEHGLKIFNVSVDEDNIEIVSPGLGVVATEIIEIIYEEV